MEYINNFQRFLSQLSETNATLDFFCDFDKITSKVAEIEISLNTLNYLIGKQDMRQAVETLWAYNSKVFNFMEILIAVRASDKKKVLIAANKAVTISSLFHDVDGVMMFMDGTGLTKLLQSGHIKDLTDYVFGVETGLDSNARKNRSGHIMENLIESLFIDNNIPYEKEVYAREFSQISIALGRDEKRFDFVIRTPQTKYLIEVNFYSGGGSKLNEVARAYSEIAPKINAIDGYEFVWITDGVGWFSAKNKLQEAYNIIPKIYNLKTIESFIELIKEEIKQSTITKSPA